MSDFNAAYPGYETTARLDELRATEYSYLDEGGHVYLDYTGSGLPARSQLRAHAARLRSGVYGNPHSDNPTSSAATLLVERARAAVLRYFNANPDEYARDLHAERHRGLPPGRRGVPVRAAEQAGADRRQPQLGQRDQGVRRPRRRPGGVRRAARPRAARQRARHARRDRPGARLAGRGSSPTRRSPTSAGSAIRSRGWRGRRRRATTSCSTRPRTCRPAAWTCPSSSRSSWRSAGTRSSASRPGSAACSPGTTRWPGCGGRGSPAAPSWG